MTLEFDQERDRLREMLLEAQREGERLKEQIALSDSQFVDIGTSEADGGLGDDEQQLLAQLVRLVDDPSVPFESAPTYKELIDLVPVVSPSVAADAPDLDTFSEADDEGDGCHVEGPSQGELAARFTIETIRSQARSLVTPQRDLEKDYHERRIERLLANVRITGDVEVGKTVDPAAAAKAKDMLVAMRYQAKQYAEERARRRLSDITNSGTT